MKKSLTICIAATLLFAMPISAQILDTTPDRIVFCADPVGNVPGVCSQFTPATVFLMITRPSDESGLTGYRCAFDVPAGVTSLGFVPSGGIIIQGMFPELAFAYTTPLPATNQTYILGTWNLMLTSPAIDVVVTRQLAPGDPFFASYSTATAAQIPLGPPDWGNGMPMGEPYASAALWLNEPVYCDYIVPEAPTSWGELKSLFR